VSAAAAASAAAVAAAVAALAAQRCGRRVLRVGRAVGQDFDSNIGKRAKGKSTKLSSKRGNAGNNAVDEWAEEQKVIQCIQQKRQRDKSPVD
jgi:hypothetical protein